MAPQKEKSKADKSSDLSRKQMSLFQYINVKK
jgi:hypothetical protein